MSDLPGPAWSEHAIWWQVYPHGFSGVLVREPHGGEVVHRLGHLETWLDYAVELGASGLALGPIFASQTHGYDTLDLFRIDPRLGDDADFDRLLESCRVRGLRVMLDGVFNHVGADHPLFQRALAEGPDSEAAQFFRIDWRPEGPRAADFEGHSGLVALDHRSPVVVDLVSEVMTHWLRRGADAWRLDAAYAVEPAFWAQVLPRVRAEFPEAWIVGEVIHGDYADLVQRSGMDSVTQYELWKAIWSSLLDGNFYELSAALERHNGFVAEFVPMTFVGNHDVTRITTRVGKPHAVLALVVLATVGGVPSIYYGDEQAFEGLKEDRLGGDDAVRPGFPATRSELAPEGWWMFALHQELLGVRRRHPWLTRARTRVDSLSNERIVYTSSAADGSESLVVELDLSPTVRARIVGGGETLFSFDG